eukprot:gene14497-biopygen23540
MSEFRGVARSGDKWIGRVHIPKGKIPKLPESCRMSTLNSFAYTTQEEAARAVDRGIGFITRDSVWLVNVHVNSLRLHLGSFQEEADAAFCYDRALVALGRPDSELNFPDRRAESESLIDDKTLMKLFGTVVKKQIQALVLQDQQYRQGSAKIKSDNQAFQDLAFTGGEVGRKRKKPAPRVLKKKVDMSESAEEDTEEVKDEEVPMKHDVNVANGVRDDNEEAVQEDEDVPMHVDVNEDNGDNSFNDDNGEAVQEDEEVSMHYDVNEDNGDNGVKEDNGEAIQEDEEVPMHSDVNEDNGDNGVNDDNREAIQEEEEVPMHNDVNGEAIQEDKGTDDVQGQGPAAASSHQDGPVPRRRRKMRFPRRCLEGV